MILKSPLLKICVKYRVSSLIEWTSKTIRTVHSTLYHHRFWVDEGDKRELARRMLDVCAQLGQELGAASIRTSVAFDVKDFHSQAAFLEGLGFRRTVASNSRFEKEIEPR